MDEEFESLVVTDPDIVDPSIDISGLRTETDVSPFLLGNIPDFAGIQYEAFNPTRLTDLMRLYGTGLPMIDTAQVPGAIDTLVDVGGGGGMDQVTGDSTATPIIPMEPGTFTAESLDQSFLGEEGPATPPTTPVDNTIKMENLSPIDIGTPDDYMDLDEYNRARDAANVSRDFKQPPEISQQLQDEGPYTPDVPTTEVLGTGVMPAFGDMPVDFTLGPAYTGEFDPDDEGTVFDTSGLTDATPEQRNTIQNILTAAGDNVQGALTELGKIPGAVVDFANQTVDVFGKKLNVGRTLASIALNKIAGGPVSLVFEVAKALLPKEDPADTLNRNIVDELKTEKDYGFNIQSGNLNQDPFGRNPVSQFGDYEQTLLDDIAGVNQSGFQTAEMREKKKEFAQDYFDKKAAKTAPQEDVGSVPGGEAALDETSSSEDIAQDFASKQTEAESRGGNIVDEFGSDGDTGRTTGPTVSLSDPDFGQFGRRQSATAAGGGNDPGGSKSKIVCTMMNESYGFGSFRNKIWMKFHKDLSPEYQKGYHKLFLPLIKISKKNIIVKKILEHIAVHSTIDMRQSMRGKTHLLGRIYRKILLPLCYWVGRHG